MKNVFDPKRETRCDVTHIMCAMHTATPIALQISYCFCLFSFPDFVFNIVSDDIFCRAFIFRLKRGAINPEKVVSTPAEAPFSPPNLQMLQRFSTLTKNQKKN